MTAFAERQNNCFGPHTVILSACWDRAGFPVDQIKISKSLLFASFHETLQPESSLRAFDLTLFITQDSFLILLPSYYVSGSHPVLDHHMTALI